MKSAFAAIVLGALALPGCEQISQWRNPAIKVCRAQLLDRLKSPASYREISVSTDAAPISKAEYQRLTSALPQLDAAMIRAKPGIYTVTISYDAANSFGAVLRGQEACQFAVRFIDQVPSEVAAQSAVDMMRGRIDAESGEPEPCCLAAFSRRDSAKLADAEKP